MKNIEMMKGSQGTPDFVVVADATFQNTTVKIGIRPLYQGGIHGSKFGLNLHHRVRFQAMDGKLDDNDINSSLLATKLPSNVFTKKSCGSYASYVTHCELIDKISDQAYLELKQMKHKFRTQVEQIVAHLEGHGAVMRYTKDEVANYFVHKACTQAAKMGVDLGDADTLDVPKDQPFVTKHGTQPTTAPSEPTAKKKTHKPKEEPKVEEPDKYAQKDLSDEDLSNMNFDELMKQIGKK